MIVHTAGGKGICLRAFGRGPWWGPLHTCALHRGHYGPCQCGCGQKEPRMETYHYSMAADSRGDADA